MAIAALATGCVAAKAVKPKLGYSNSLMEKQTEILLQESGHMTRNQVQDKLPGGNGCPSYQQLTGDYQNLGFVAALMAASKHAIGNETVVFTKDPIKPFWIEQPLNPS